MKRCMVLFALGITNWMYHSFNGHYGSSAKHKAHQAPSTPTMLIKQLKQR